MIDEYVFRGSSDSCGVADSTGGIRGLSDQYQWTFAQCAGSSTQYMIDTKSGKCLYGYGRGSMALHDCSSSDSIFTTPLTPDRGTLIETSALGGPGALRIGDDGLVAFSEFPGVDSFTEQQLGYFKWGKTDPLSSLVVSVMLWLMGTRQTANKQA